MVRAPTGLGVIGFAVVGGDEGNRVDVRFERRPVSPSSLLPLPLDELDAEEPARIRGELCLALRTPGVIRSPDQKPSLGKYLVGEIPPVAIDYRCSDDVLAEAPAVELQVRPDGLDRKALGVKNV